MCGICGVAYSDPSRPVAERLLEGMRDRIAHRGPDGLGLRRWPGAGIAHTRLSIIDLAGGAQPLANEDESVWVTFNGEIYNYRELTALLEDRGHRFRTRSDTEVLVHLYEEFGLDFPARLNGMFALALYDRERRRTVLVRDHLGIKPLFYAVTSKGLFYGSNVSTVLAGADLSPTIRRESLQEYLIFRYVAGDRSFFEGVHRLPGGHLAVWEQGRLELRRFWELAPQPDRGRRHPEALAEELDRRLRQSVTDQLVSDVPVGTFCSGGVDSGLVTGYAAASTGADLDSFSVGFDESAWDETPMARDTAERFGTRHHVLRARAEDVPELLPELVARHEEPLSHPNSVPLYQLSRFARERVKVVLTGEGADELFCGYPRYHIARLRGLLEGVPVGVLRLTGALRALPGHRVDKLADLLPLPLEDSLLLNSAYVAPDRVADLTGEPVAPALTHRRQLLRRASRGTRDATAALSRYELLTYVGCALDRMDRMSMAWGLEARVPFLDVDLVEWGAGLSSSVKLRGTETKWLLKQVARGRLSDAIVDGGKSGFGLPLGAWFRRPAFDGLVDRLCDPQHPAAGHVRSEGVAEIVREHRNGEHDHGEILWLLANLYVWTEVWGGQPRKLSLREFAS